MQLLPDPPVSATDIGAIAQLGERLVCNQKVTGSIPVGSTSPTCLARTAPHQSMLRLEVSLDRVLLAGLRSLTIRKVV